MKKAVIFSSRENRFMTLKAELEQRGIEVVMIERETVNSKALLAEKAEELGKVDYLIISSLCDDKFRKVTLHDLSTEDYLEWKYYALIQYYEINATFVKKMVANGGGVVLGVISEAGKTPSKGECLNGAAGAALHMGIQCLAEECREDGIAANTVALGVVEENDDFYPMIRDAEILKHVPSGACITKEEACKSIADVLLCTNGALTGNLVNVDSAFSCAYMREW
jgi:short-subunit dehydrogenase